MKDYTILSKEQYLTRFPRNEKTDIDKADTDVLNYFLKLYSFYYHLLEQYILEKFPLKKYDDYILKSPLNYKKVDLEHMDVYQYLSSNQLSYFYLRNNIYVERFTPSEIEFLDSKMSNFNDKMDDETRNFIENTLYRVIVETNKQSGKIVMTNFGPPSPQYYALMNSIVIGFRYDEFYKENLTDDEWDEQHTKQRMELKEFIKNIQAQIQQKFSIPVTIIEYNDFSVKSLNDNFINNIQSSHK